MYSPDLTVSMTRVLSGDRMWEVRLNEILPITWTQTYLKFESLSHGNCTRNPKPLKTEVPEGLLSHLEAANGSQPPPYQVDRLLVAMQSENPRMSFLSRTKVWYCAGQHQRDFWGLYSLTLQIATVLHTLQAAMRDRRDIHSHRTVDAPARKVAIFGLAAQCLLHWLPTCFFLLLLWHLVNRGRLRKIFAPSVSAP